MPQQDPRAQLQGPEPKVIPGPITLYPWEDPPAAAAAKPAVTLYPWEDPAPVPPGPVTTYPVPPHPGPAAVPGIVAPGWVKPLAETERALGILGESSGLNLASDIIGGGGQAALDLIVGNPQGPARDRFYNALNTVSSGINNEPMRSGQQIVESLKAFGQGDINKAANHLWYSIPFFGAAGEKMAEYLDKGDYLGALSHGIGTLAPFAHEPIASGVQSAADAASTAGTFTRGAIPPVVRETVKHVGEAALGEALGGHRGAGIALIPSLPKILRSGLAGGRAAVADAAALDALARSQAALDAQALIAAQDARLARGAQIFEGQERIVQPPGQIPPERQLGPGGGIAMPPAGTAAEEARVAGLGPEAADVAPAAAAPAEAATTIAPKVTLDELALSPDSGFGKKFAKLNPQQQAQVQRLYDLINAVGPVEVPSQAAQEAARKAAPTAELSVNAADLPQPPAAPVTPPVAPPEPPFKPGDTVQWQSQGVDQFQEPRQVRGFSPDGKYAFVEGTNTGIPVEQLTRQEVPHLSVPEQLQQELRNEMLRSGTLSPETPAGPPPGVAFKTTPVADEPGRLGVEVTKGNQRIGTMELVQHPTELEVDLTHLRPEFRGQGYGKAMYQQAMEQARQLGKKYLTSGSEFTEDAARVWRSLGGEQYTDAAGDTRWRLPVKGAGKDFAAAGRAAKLDTLDAFLRKFGVPEQDWHNLTNDQWHQMADLAGVKELSKESMEAIRERFGEPDAETVPVTEGMTPQQAQAAIENARATQPTSTTATTGGMWQGLQSAGDAALQRMRDRGTFSGTRLNAGIPLDDFKDMAIWGASKLGQGVTRFPDWKKAMIGDAVSSGAAGQALQAFKRQLQDLHSAAREYALKYDVVPYKPGMPLDDIHPLTSETIPKAGETLVTTDVQKYLENQVRKTMGGVPEDASDSVKARRLMYLGRKEFTQQLAQPYSGVDWYGPDTAHGDTLLRQAFPELHESTNNTIQKAMSAAMSNNSNPLFEAFNGARIWEKFRETGRFPLKQPNGKNWPAQGIGFQINKLNTMLDTLGPERTADFLRGDVSGREIKQFAPSAKGIRLNETYPGSLVLGPKIGRYFNDVMDLPQEGSTVDLWMMRQKGRRLGQLLDSKGNAIEAPRTEGERNLQMDVDRRLGEENGLAPRDAQSVGWHYELELYRRLGLKAKSYRRSQGIQQFINSLGR